MKYLAAALGALILLVVGIIQERRERRAFEAKFPPISDDEFMALCPPGTHREVALKVRQILSVSLGVDYSRIYPASRLVADLGC